jgi:hypothetical protein
LFLVVSVGFLIAHFAIFLQSFSKKRIIHWKSFFMWQNFNFHYLTCFFYPISIKKLVHIYPLWQQISTCMYNIREIQSNYIYSPYSPDECKAKEGISKPR